MKHPVTAFDALSDIVERHGYVLARVEGSHRVFVHRKKDHPSILLPLRDRSVTRAHLQAVRRILDETNVLPAGKFDDAMRLEKAG